MWTDPIVAELHRIRERHAKQFGYDLRRMFQDLKREQAGGRSCLCNESCKVVYLKDQTPDSLFVVTA